MVKNRTIENSTNKKQIDFNDNLYSALSICEGKFCYNSEFSRIYSFATENVAGYIDYFDFIINVY